MRTRARLPMLATTALALLVAAPAAQAVRAPLDPTWTHPPITGSGLTVERMRPGGAIVFSTSHDNGTFDPNDNIRRLRQIDAAGRPDRTFSGDGVLDLPARQHMMFWHGQQLITDRRVYTRELGWRSNVELRRYRGDGSIDRTWGTNGVSELWLVAPWDAKPDDGGRDDEVCDGWPTSTGYAVLVLDDDRTLNLLHLTERGLPDVSVGTRGWTRIDPLAGLPLSISGCFRSTPLAGGDRLMQFEGSDELSTKQLVRLDPQEGRFVTSWGIDGLRESGHRSADGGLQVTTALQLSDGRILAKRVEWQTTREVVPGGAVNSTTVLKLGLVALRADGSADPRFGGDGIVDVATIRPPQAEGDALPLVAFHRGRIVVVVSREQSDRLPLPSVHRYLVNGTPDQAFGVGGAVQIGPISGIVAAMDPRGRLVVHDLSEGHPQFQRYRTDTSDLALSTMSVDRVGAALSAKLRLRSFGPLAAERVRVTIDVASAGARLGASVDGRSCSRRAAGEGLRITCTLPPQLATQSAVIVIRGRVSPDADLRIAATSSTPDHRPRNDRLRIPGRKP